MRRAWSLLAATAFLLLPARPATAQVVGVAELDQNPEAFAGRTVTLEGELIGDYGRRGDMVWVQMNDDPYAQRPIPGGGEPVGTNQGIGLRIPARLFAPDAWGPPGSARYRGPVIRVVGEFRYHDPALAGETYVQVSDIVLMDPARPLPRGELGVPGRVGLVLIVVAALIFAVAKYRARPPRA